MYKTIIIEDDIPVLRQLNNTIPSIDSNFEIVMNFSHPQDALDYLANNHVDVIITDIHLPQISGIEVLEYCNTNYPDIKFAIISAYDNFEYAQKAIDLEVVHYVLKPITISKLEVMLEKLSKKLKRTPHTEGFIASSTTLQRQQVILNLISGFYSDYSLFFSDMQKNDVLLYENNCNIAVLSITFENFFHILQNKKNYSKEEIHNIITNIVDKNNSSIYSVLFNYSDNNFTIFIFGKTADSAETFRQEVSEYLSEISSDISNILDMTTTLLTLSTFQNIDEFYKTQRKNSSFDEQAKNILSYIYDNDFDAAIRCIETLKMIFDEMQTKYIYSYILSHLPSSPQHLPESSNASSKTLLNILVTAIQNIKRDNNTYNHKNDVIENARKFINDNFANDITLEDVAKHVYLSPIYFSSYFKKKTGEKYSDYLQNIKIKKAMELLEDTDVKIPTISEMSGFRDVNYFHKIFKNQIGLTPSEYRKKFRGEN